VNTNTLRMIVVVSVLYISAQIFSDIASLRILFIAGFSIDGGTLVYPFTFTLRDMVHKIAGKSIAQTLIFLGVGINLFMVFLFWLVSELPADIGVGEQSEFGIVLVPIFRLVLASIVAEVVAELLDTEMYDQWMKRVGKEHQWGRVLVSNAISVPVDSAIFVVIAFVGVFSSEVVWSIFFANIIVKGFVTILSIPGIYLVKERDDEEVIET